MAKVLQVGFFATGLGQSNLQGKGDKDLFAIWHFRRAIHPSRLVRFSFLLTDQITHESKE